MDRPGPAGFAPETDAHRRRTTRPTVARHPAFLTCFPPQSGYGDG